LSFGLFALAVVWALRRAPRRLLALAAGGLLAVGLGYAWTGLHALGQAGTASRFVSFASPWRLLVAPLEAVLDDRLARNIITVLAWLAFALVTLLLARSLPVAVGAGRCSRGDMPAGRPAVGRAAEDDPDSGRDPGGGRARLCLAAHRDVQPAVVRRGRLGSVRATGREPVGLAADRAHRRPRRGVRTQAVVPLPAVLNQITKQLRGARPDHRVALIGITVRWSGLPWRRRQAPTAPQPPGTPRGSGPRVVDQGASTAVTTIATSPACSTGARR
jgi:hypothetical protein